MTDDDRELELFVGAARAELDRRAKVGAFPDFAAMFERAHELDPERVDEATLAEARRLPPLATPESPTREEPELAPFTAALREHLDAGVDERRASSIPAPRFVRPRSLRRRRTWNWVAAAVVLLLIGGGVSAMIGSDRFEPGVERSSGDLGRLLESLRPAADDPEPAPEPEPEPPLSSDEPVSVEEVDPAPTVTELDTPAVEPAPAERPRKRKPSSDEDSLAELDARAQALWKAGDVDGAEQIFREIVRRGGRGRWAELAYGELFSLARRHGGSQREALWREYLAAFPKGRYAEDARASLCRRADADERDACWSDYLSRHPKGTHADEARRALDERAP